MKIIRCPSCEGYGWFDDAFTGEAEECDWCGGVGYVYSEGDTNRRIPAGDFEQVADELERLEQGRLRDMGYQGEAKKPWHQDIRKGTKLGKSPDDRDE